MSHLGLIISAPAWHEQANCTGIGNPDHEVMFPEPGGSVRPAKRLCARCDVKAECLEYALKTDTRYGVWGGLSETERRDLKRRRPQPGTAAA